MTGPLADIYDDVTLARLDGSDHPPFDPRAARGVRSQIAAGALLTGLILGFDAVFAPEREKEVIEEVDLDSLVAPDQRVVYLHVPDAPRASIAFVRP